MSVCSAFDDPQTLAELSNLGVLFLLFEMGLELSTDRLRALSRYAFGLGTVQVFATTLAFVLFAVPFGKSLGTLLLQKLAFADVQISSINSWDEALVIAVSLSLSSSAFVLQILGDKGQLASRSGSATLGILLLQDLVTVPFLVLLPVLESATGSGAGVAAAAASTAGAVATGVGPIAGAIFAALAAGASAFVGQPFGMSPSMGDPGITSLAQEFLPTAMRSALLMGSIAFFGRFGLRRVFEAVATTGSGDAFVATCILTVLGTSMATEAAGFGETLGAFVAGALLAETSFRPQARPQQPTNKPL
jgi:Kef-type K+ transport system membrane component KefB